MDRFIEEEIEHEGTDENNAINEFGEEISTDKLGEIARKVKKLEPKEIDELFFDCGFRAVARGNNKALSDEKIAGIKNEETIAIEMITALFRETPKEDFLYVIKDRTGLYSKVTLDDPEDKED